jgi:hypothetical protein
MAFGQRFNLGPLKCPAVPELFLWCRDFYKLATKLLEEGKLKPHRPIVREGGLKGVLEEGLWDTRQRKISGHKLVYKM